VKETLDPCNVEPWNFMWYISRETQIIFV